MFARRKRRLGWRSRARPVREGGRRERLHERVANLEQRHWDLIALALVAASAYLGFVLYGGWDGGRVGSAVEVGLEHAAGAVAYAVPIVLAGTGLALISRPFIASPGALNAGAVLLVGGLLLAFAAETAGLGPDRPARDGYFDPDFFTVHGGAVGEALYWSSATLFQRLGAHILALLLLATGVLLLTGSTISGLLASAGRGMRTLRSSALDVARSARAASSEPEFGTEIAITRANPTEAFETELAGPGDDEDAGVGAEGEAHAATLNYDETVEEMPEGPEASGGEGEISAEAVELTPMGNRRSGVTESEEVDYSLPSTNLLVHGKGDPGPDTRDREATGKALLEALGHFGVDAKIVGVVSGPHVSRYELQLAPGTKVSKITQLKDDLAYALASTEIRILAPIPGKRAVGVEIPNQRRRLVRLGDIYQGRPKGSSPLVGWLGKDVAGHAIWTDLAKMPHVLVAGTTGSGKSGCINAILSSVLMHASPNEARLVLVDPKRVELNHYESIPHLLTPVVTAPRLAANVLANLIVEMESRYQVMGEARARNLAELNKARGRAGERFLPHILCVIDELADLMMIAPAEVEDSIIRLAQKSRAVGIHLVLATQRPSTDVITGTIKVNIPARIAFAVASQVDSRVILDQGGAEGLLGQGDMLFRPAGTSKLQRIQGAFVTEEEIARLVAHWQAQGEPEFQAELLESRADLEEADGEGELDPDRDDLLTDAIRLVVQTQTASVSMIQRRLRVGYTRAGRLIDMLERRGVISGYEGSKPRQVLIGEADLPVVLQRVEAAPAEGDDGAVEPQTATSAHEL